MVNKVCWMLGWFFPFQWEDEENTIVEQQLLCISFFMQWKWKRSCFVKKKAGMCLERKTLEPPQDLWFVPIPDHRPMNGLPRVSTVRGENSKDQERQLKDTSQAPSCVFYAVWPKQENAFARRAYYSKAFTGCIHHLLAVSCAWVFTRFVFMFVAVWWLQLLGMFWLLSVTNIWGKLFRPNSPACNPALLQDVPARHPHLLLVWLPVGLSRNGTSRPCFARLEVNVLKLGTKAQKENAEVLFSMGQKE